MTNLRQAAQQALEALEQLDGIDTETECVTIDAGDVITALRKALAQPEFYQPAAQEAVEILMSMGYMYEPTYTGLAWVAKKSAQPEQESVAYDKTELNRFVQSLYDEKMREGKHGHYEALFYCVHQAIKRAAHGIKEGT